MEFFPAFNLVDDLDVFILEFAFGDDGRRAEGLPVVIPRLLLGDFFGIEATLCHDASEIPAMLPMPPPEGFTRILIKGYDELDIDTVIGQKQRVAIDDG